MAQENRTEVRALLKERASKLKELRKELKWIRNDQNQMNDVDDLERKYEHLDEMKEDQMMEYAKNIQDEDMNILDRVIIDVDQTQAQAADVAEKVAAQTEQIGRVGKHLDEISDELERAKRVLKIMLRRVMTDKIVWCFLGLVVIAIVAIIAWHILESDKDADEDDKDGILN